LAIAVAVASFAAPGVAQADRKGPARGRADDLSRARALDKEGAKAYGEGRYKDAIKHFEEAYRLGGPPFELWNVAKCHLRLDQVEKAVEMLERYLATPNLPKDDRDEAARQLDQIKKRPSALTVSSTPSGAQVTIDGKSVEGQTPVSVEIPPGSHTVTVTLPTHVPYTRRVDARYGRAVTVNAALGAPQPQAGAGEARPPPPEGGGGAPRPPPPDHPYNKAAAAPVALRGAFGVMLPRYGSIGGTAGIGVMALGTYQLAEMSGIALSVGGLVTVSGDSWGNRTGQPNTAAGCGPITDAQSATALSVFALGSASVPITPKVRIVGLGGAGMAGYFVGDVGGDLFLPSCRASPGVRPALLFGAEIDYVVTQYLRLSAFPLTWQFQPAFDGARDAPRDASGLWMRFGISIGAGVDL
jgi:hypothetical protein